MSLTIITTLPGPPTHVRRCIACHRCHSPVLRTAVIEGVDGASYYAFSPHRDWRFIVIDSYDVSVLGWPEGHPNRDAAVQILQEKNPNEVDLPPAAASPYRCA